MIPYQQIKTKVRSLASVKVVMEKFSLKTASMLIACAITFACVAACIIAASPSTYEEEPAIVYTEGPARVNAPAAVQTVAVTETEALILPETSNEIVTFLSGGLFASAPELDEAPETEATPEIEIIPETEAPAVTAAPAVAEIPEITEAPMITKAPEIEAIPECEAPEPAASKMIFPDPNSRMLVDEIGLLHNIVTPVYTITEEELMMAAKVVQLEVMGDGSSLYGFEDIQEKYWEMLSVAQCIRNRVESRKFPSSVKEVITQSHTGARGQTVYQFYPADQLAPYVPSEEAIIAAREVLVDGISVLPTNYYFFCATRITDTFEFYNDYMLEKTADGVYDKIEGHLTTFYAGHR